MKGHEQMRIFRYVARHAAREAVKAPYRSARYHARRAMHRKYRARLNRRYEGK